MVMQSRTTRSASETVLAPRARPTPRLYTRDAMHRDSGVAPVPDVTRADERPPVRVLLADAETQTARAVADVLPPSRYEITTATTGPDVARLLAANRFDV